MLQSKETFFQHNSITTFGLVRAGWQKQPCKFQIPDAIGFSSLYWQISVYFAHESKKVINHFYLKDMIKSIFGVSQFCTQFYISKS